MHNTGHRHLRILLDFLCRHIRVRDGHRTRCITVIIIITIITVIIQDRIPYIITIAKLLTGYTYLFKQH
ncbi:hypothetical protein GA0116948_104285 [Chitinophaga costaii]|uniref:Uncharacterized protein n=1 Tax=Chitinophaga costaii TaxID=1335309 RepID=A0A1C4CT97_9BACT|nr:hypothetical protein DCM91_06890 [Chitinophaga costaii]SCC22269.1 hypothetical protein GA0116948_104285 [Chitinophaga costaii]